jgi:hypothetical protein
LLSDPQGKVVFPGTHLKCNAKIKYPLRIIGYRASEIRKDYGFATNADHLDAKTVDYFCKERWQIELIFRRIKYKLMTICLILIGC